MTTREKILRQRNKRKFFKAKIAKVLYINQEED